MLRLASLTATRRLLPWTPTTARCHRIGRARRLLGHTPAVISSEQLSCPLPPKGRDSGTPRAGPATARGNRTWRHPWRVAPGRGAPLTSSSPSLKHRPLNRRSSSSRSLSLSRQRRNRISTCSEAPARRPRTAASNFRKAAAATTRPCRSPATVSARAGPSGLGTPGPVASAPPKHFRLAGGRSWRAGEMRGRAVGESELKKGRSPAPRGPRYPSSPLHIYPPNTQPTAKVAERSGC